MFALLPLVVVSLFSRGALAGTTIWSGSFNAYPSASAFDNWSWADEVGEYQWYIHGTQPTSHYLATDPSFKNPADTAENLGLKLTVDSTSQWNSQFQRTELIPQTSQNLGAGNLFYHFSMMHTATNPPDTTSEHQVLFFESHFTEFKYGVGPNVTNLEWMVSSQPQWGTPLVANTWFNFAYDIDFSAGTVGLWASTGSSPLVKVVQNMPASTSTNSEDWHLGFLRLTSGSTTEDWYFSGVYIESGPITTSIGSGAVTPPSSSSGVGTTTAVPTSTASSSVSSTSTAAVATQTQWGQCGGTGYTGATVCASGFTCKAVSPPYYYQCQ